jgi:hypothetical protein
LPEAERCAIPTAMDATEHYRHLIALGRDEFLAAAAPAALVRYRREDEGREGDHTLTLDEMTEGETIEETLPHGKFSVTQLDMEIYPLVKKPGASFPDRITIGRTANNDIVIADHSVSRLHAYIKHHGGGWVVADAGSKNGSWLRGHAMDARRELAITSRTVMRLGDVDVTFYLAADLFSVLGGGA